MNWFQRHWREVSLVVLASGFFIVYQYLYWGFYHEPVAPVPHAGTFEPGYLIFNQPDEMANYLFIREWVLHDRIGLVEPLSGVALNQVHPRSMTVVKGNLVPIGFPGFIVFVAMILKAIHFLDNGVLFNYLVVMVTPLLAVIAPLLLYGIIRRLFEDKTIAWLSSTLLFVSPPWSYYASRPLQHMTLFVTLVLVAGYCLILNKTRPHRWTLFLFSFFGCLSLYIRPSEWLWTLILFSAFIRAVKPKYTVHSIFSAVIGLTMVGALFFATQTAFYGSPLASGYVRPQINGDGGLITSGPQGIPLLKALFLPFGFHPLIIFKTLYHYGFKLIAPWTVATLIGLVWLLSTRQKMWRDYSITFGVTGILILLYYGSWNFADNLSGAVSIGSSQARYFLPLYVLSIPFIAFLLKEIWAWSNTGRLSSTLIFLVLILFSLKAVFFQFEGLWDVKNTVANYYYLQKQVYERTPASAIIITRYADKYLFPDRRVVTDWSDDSMVAIQKLLKLGFPVFWYDLNPTFSGTGEMKPEIMQAFWDHSLFLDDHFLMWDDLRLYRVVQTPSIADRLRK